MTRRISLADPCAAQAQVHGTNDGHPVHGVPEIEIVTKDCLVDATLCRSHHTQQLSLDGAWGSWCVGMLTATHATSCAWLAYLVALPDLFVRELDNPWLLFCQKSMGGLGPGHRSVLF